MKINIVSYEDRYKIVCNRLCKDGFDARLCIPSSVDFCDFLLLSVRRELSYCELEEIFIKINEKTVVLCGDDNRIGMLFSGKIIDYSNYDDFLQKNAHLTAEATVSFIHSATKEALYGKKVFVSGYGRIGSELCDILKCLGAQVYANARRDSKHSEMERKGIFPSPICDSVSTDIIINTVPFPIFSKELIETIPKNTMIVELASQPYGFETMDRVTLCSGLPGKILPLSAASVICDTVISILSETGRG